MRIEWRNAAYLDALNIVDYINIDNPAAAFSMYDEINNQITMLGKNPNMGRLGGVQGTRELIINRTPYIAAYMITENAIIILRVLHGAQQWPKQLNVI